MKYDYLIVGSGLFGSVLANTLNKCGKKIFIIDKREHFGGNVYTENLQGINVHKYGPHIFHTNSEKVWEFINQFATFNNFVNRVKAVYKNKIYSLPINLQTFYEIAGCKTPQEAESYLFYNRIKLDETDNLEDWILSKVGPEIYQTLIKGYTKKQWMKDPKELPVSIISRLPIRFNFNDNYYDAKYQGIPIGGYTNLVQNMLDGIKLELAIDFKNIKYKWEDYARHLIYSGPIDEYFDCCFGALEYRSLKFEELELKGDFQGNAQVNYTDYEVPHTRIIEHKHFEFQQIQHTIITKEYPANYQETKEAYYPINTAINNQRYEQYKTLAKDFKNVTFGGRLGSYKYYDMDQVIAQALRVAESLI
jgi:UDP-galactopyranose mutase